MFAAAQVIGLFIAKNYAKAMSVHVVKADFSFIDLITIIFLLFLFFYFLKHRSKKSSLFFKIILAVAITFGAQAAFSFFFNVLLSAILAALLAYFVLTKKIVVLNNIAIILAIAGIGAIFGLSISSLTAVFILLFMSFYDIIAVYKTRHMVHMAREMIRSGAIFGIIIPTKSGSWFEKINNVQPGDRFMILGSGDIAMPLILISSVVKEFGMLASLIVMIFSGFGLFLTYYLFMTQKERAPMAALPPIAVASIIGYLLVNIFI